MFMTEGQRDYLADLAGKKGVKLEDTSDKSVAWASMKIEELKALPDKVFSAPSPEIDSSIAKRTTAITREISKWTFQA